MFRKLILFAILVTLLTACQCVPTDNDHLAVTLHPQETSMWCWAASGQMTMEFLGSNVNQCTQANDRLGRNDCCNLPVPAGCRHPA